jgi:hypothetical protein
MTEVRGKTQANAHDRVKSGSESMPCPQITERFLVKDSFLMPETWLRIMIQQDKKRQSAQISARVDSKVCDNVKMKFMGNWVYLVRQAQSQTIPPLLYTNQHVDRLAITQRPGKVLRSWSWWLNEVMSKLVFG